MGFADCGWMEEVLRSFDEIVCNVANTYRLQEACDILVLRLSKYRRQIELADFKAVMLASLRSLVPQSWDSEHEDSSPCTCERAHEGTQAHNQRSPSATGVADRISVGLVNLGRRVHVVSSVCH